MTARLSFRTLRAAALAGAAALAAGVGAGSARADSLTTGLEGYWQFNGSGADSSGNGNTLGLFGGAGYTSAGLFGQGLSLDGAEGSFARELTANSAFNFGSGDFTVQVWANLTNNNGREETLIEQFTGGGGPGWTFTLAGGSSLQFYSQPAGTASSGGQSIPSGVWQQFIVERSGNTIDEFHDGALVASATFSGTLPASSNPLLIGARNGVDGRNFTVNGSIDEVGIWDRALSTDEIAYLYNGGAGNEVISGGVPEPASWALMISGFGGMGVVLRRRRRALAAA
jgi:hypothetical protein